MKENKRKSNVRFKATDNDLYESNYEDRKKWFEEISEDPREFEPVSEQILVALKEEAKKCLDSEVANYNIKNAKTNANYQWMKTVMSKGTASDKIAAHTVAIQDKPVYSLDTLQSLVNMVKVGKKKDCLVAIDTLTELFLEDLLKPDQLLKAFHQRPLSCLNQLTSGNAVTRRKLLSYWYFEDQLKELYVNFVLALNNVAHDSVDNNKEKAITAMYKLLSGNPEQEKNLLAHIVNKLGDPSQKVASKAIYNLGQLLRKHPNMQGVVLQEVEKLLFRSNISTKTQYYGLCFLSQFYLSHDTPEVARRLIEVYFAFFKACVKKGEVDSRMMSALLMGVNRAYPYAKIEFERISDHVDTMYRIVHVANFNISLHALSLLYHVSDSGNSVSDRFYSTLYKKLADPRLLSTTYQAMLLSLIYKALLKDSEIPRIKVFIKRLLQLCLFMQPSFACGVLYLVSQLIGKKPDCQSLILKQTSLSGVDDNDEEEKYRDIPDEATDTEKEKHEALSDEEDVKPDINLLNQALAQSSWYHHSLTNKNNSAIARYNPLSRNPLYAGGEFCAYTELIYLKNHHHPSVSLFATNILEGNIIKYTGDPLKDFTLIRFLDRFVFKNPKKSDETADKGAHPTFGKRKFYNPKGVRSLPVNSLSYVNEMSENIPVDELFLHNYLQKKYAEKQLKDENDSDLESVQSDEFEDMLQKMTGTMKDGEDLDYLNDIGENLKQKKKDKKKKAAETEEVEEEVSEDESEPEEMSIDDLSDDDLGDDIDMTEGDEELLDDLESDEDEDIVFDEEPKQSKKRKSMSKSKLNEDITSLFASAEEFASLLDEEGSSKVAPGSSNEFANKDNAAMKQIAWEDKRNRWVQGFNKATKQNKSSKNFNNSKNFGKKRNGKNKFGNKTKKIKSK